MLKNVKCLPAVLGIGLLACLAAERAAAQGVAPEKYIACSFRPQMNSCEAVYRAAIKDPSPAAVAVKEAVENYGRYVRAAKGGLTDDDRRLLRENGITLPTLDAEDQAGLHAFLQNLPPGDDADARRRALNNFIGRAVQAELYCGFNDCAADSPSAAPGV